MPCSGFRTKLPPAIGEEGFRGPRAKHWESPSSITPCFTRLPATQMAAVGTFSFHSDEVNQRAVNVNIHAISSCEHMRLRRALRPRGKSTKPASQVPAGTFISTPMGKGGKRNADTTFHQPTSFIYPEDVEEGSIPLVLHDVVVKRRGTEFTLTSQPQSEHGHYHHSPSKRRRMAGPDQVSGEPLSASTVGSKSGQSATKIIHSNRTSAAQWIFRRLRLGKKYQAIKNRN